MREFESPRICFSAYFEELPEPLSEVFERFAAFLHEQVGLPTKWLVMEKESLKFLKRGTREVIDVIRTQNAPGFHVKNFESNRIALVLEPISGGLMRQDTLVIKGWRLRFTCDSGAGTPDNWWAFLEGIASRWPIILATEFDLRYTLWQHADSVESYLSLSLGKIPPNMKRWFEPPIDGIGPTRTRLDISKNPGRSSTGSFIRSSVAAQMWLGNLFWNYVPSQKSQVLEAEFFLEKKDFPEFAYIKSWPEPFTRPDGEQGQIQQQLWRLLFHEDCEWPPGSGAISDEPMYGPPELMPGYKPPAIS